MKTFTKRISVTILVILLFLCPLAFTETNLNFEKTKTDRKFVNIQSDSHVLNVGMGNKITWPIDPHFTFGAIDIVNQICEPLYKYNLSNPEPEIIPNLALDQGNWSLDKLNFTVELRDDVYFHDGKKLDAEAVKWNFDRIAYLTNSTGEINDQANLSASKQNFMFYNYEKQKIMPIINKTIVVDNYIIRFLLNTQYAPLKHLLSSFLTAILSPDSTPQNSVIEEGAGLVGSGPFKFVSSEETQVELNAYTNYRFKTASLDKVYFKYYTNLTKALLNGSIDFNGYPSLSSLESLNQSSDVNLINGGPLPSTFYMGMNNKKINVTWREAICRSIDYERLINEWPRVDRQALRSRSPIPKTIPFANWSFDAPTFDLPYARLLMQSMGFGTDLDRHNDTQWINIANNNPFRSLNFSNLYGQPLYNTINESLANIGINVTNVDLTWEGFINRSAEVGDYNRDMLELYVIGWNADYLDPHNFINPLFTNRTLAWNTGQVNDGELQQWLEEAAKELDLEKRQELYNKIQKRIVEKLHTHAWLANPINFDAYNSDLLGYKTNSYDIIYFYDCEWKSEPTYQVDLSSPPNINYTEGTTGHNITWEITTDTISDAYYEIYRNSSLVIKNDFHKTHKNVSINIDYLKPDEFKYQLKAFNGGKLQANDSVYVKVLKEQLNDDSTDNNQTDDEDQNGPDDGQDVPNIPGYSPILISFTSLFIVYIVQRKIRKSKE